MFYQYNVLNHLQPIRTWAKAHDARISLCPETFELGIAAPTKNLSLLPRFMVRLPEKGVAYTSVFTSACRFVGWLPYPIKRWPEASDKLIFKACCEEQGLRTPAYWHDMPPPGADYIVKPRNGSWGKGIGGPFRAPEQVDLQFLPQADPQSDLPATLAEGEYYEQFIPGKPAKIWFWNAQPVAMDVIELPTVFADGRRSLAQILAERRGNFDPGHVLKGDNAILTWQGVTPESVPPAGKSFLLDFLYATPFDRVEIYSRDSLAQQSSERRSELEAIGANLFDVIAPDIRMHTLFTLDTVIDRQERLWLLEMNSHTVVHPNSYVHMLNDVFLSGSAQPSHPIADN